MMPVPSHIPKCMRVLGLLAVTVLMADGPAATTTLPLPTLPDFNGFPQKTIAKAPIVQIALGTFDVTLGRTTLDDIRNAAGAGDIARRGDVGRGVAWLCFTSGRDRVWIDSSEIFYGRNTHTVSGVVAMTGSRPLTADAGCPSLHARVAIHGGVNTALGAPSAEPAGWHLYSYMGMPTFEMGSEEDDLVVIRVVGGKVTALSVGHSVSD